MKPICHITTPFPEKFGVPRQPLLVEEALGQMIFTRNDFFNEAFRGIENFSHLWLIFEFHKVREEDVTALVRPPRFQGKEKWGVYATRSPHRPNRLGLSVVKFHKLEEVGDEIHLWVKGVDLVSGTPVFDIKPYIPYADSYPEANASDFSEAPKSYPVRWDCAPSKNKGLIEKVIALDPRPGHQNQDENSYGVSIAGENIRFKREGETFVILSVKISS